MKTNTIFIPMHLFWHINSQACPELIFIIRIKKETQEYDCDRSSQTYCSGEGWCPIRYSEAWFTPKMRSNGSGWRKY